jgi:aromatic-L-amino-acid decarboxylase
MILPLLNPFLNPPQGSFLICEEFAYLSEGVEYADSFNFNAHKAMMVNFDCSPMWFKNGAESIAYFNVDPAYLKHEYQTVSSDYRVGTIIYFCFFP